MSSAPMALCALQACSSNCPGLQFLFRSHNVAVLSRRAFHNVSNGLRAPSHTFPGNGRGRTTLNFTSHVRGAAVTSSAAAAAVRLKTQIFNDAVKQVLSRFSPQIQRKFASHAGKRLPFEPEIVTKDTLIYSFSNDFYYKVLTYFGVGQFAFWLYLTWFTFTNLRDAPVQEGALLSGSSDSQNPAWWRKINLGDNKYKNAISLLCFTVGYIVLFVSLMYPLRSVRNLTILRGGQMVKITTHGWFGKTKSFNVPVSHLSAIGTRTDKTTQIPIKVKRKWFFFLLDKKGTFHNVKLFDNNVGLKRML